MIFKDSRIILCFLVHIIVRISSTDCNTQDIYEPQLVETSNDNKINNGFLKWVCPFNELIENVDKPENWYKYLNGLFCKFSEYEVQSARRNYTITHARGSGNQECDIEEFTDYEVTKFYINRSNFKIFLNKSLKCITSENVSTENIVDIEIQIAELNLILNLTLRDNLRVNCEGKNIYIKGNYITTGDLRDILLLQNELIDEECKKLLLNKKSKFLNIFALNTFFVDITMNSSLLNKLKIKQISIIAPKWENIGENKIELDGKHAELPKPSNGLNGEPGIPGRSGGNFFGIGKEFVSCENLTISVNGGDGSNGEEGKNGGNGRNGATPIPPSNLYCSDRLCDGDGKIYNFKCNKIDCEYTYQRRYNSEVKWIEWCKYEIFGGMGTKGKDGGNGGKGGKGGYPGNIMFFELNNPSDILFLNNSGKDGENGKGGLGGVGGKKGNDITVRCRSTYWKNYWSLLNTKISNETAESGENGTDGGNSNSLDNPIPPLIFKSIDKAKVINLYKSYLRENLDNRMTHYFLNDFLTHLDSNDKVRNVYDTLGFIDDLQHLEEQFLKLSNNINFLPFYQSFLERITEYSKAPKETENLNQYKMILGYLYTATLSRIHNMEDNFESNLIVDINAYFKSIKEDIDKLKDLQNAKYKETLINKYKDDYKKQIDTKIEDAKEMISKEIVPEIDNIGAEIGTQIQSLVNEIIYLQNEVQLEHDELIQKQQHLGNVMILQGLFSAFKIFAQIVSFLGPVGAVAGSVIATGSSVAESFISSDTNVPKSEFKLPQSVSDIESIKGQITNITNQRISCLKDALDATSLEIINHQDILGSISIKILDIKNRLNKIDRKTYNNTEVETLQNELEETLDKRKGELNQENAKKIAVIENLKRTIQLITLMPETYNKLKNDGEKLDTINFAIKQNEEKFKKLKQYEQYIYTTVMPMLQNIQNDLQNILDNLGTKSEVALDVSKWHVTSTLRDMVLLMKKLTQGFKVQDNLQRCVEKLKEAMVTAINVHQHIQDYQKDRNLADFISTISSVSVNSINIVNNPEVQETLRNTIRDLEITVRSNMVIQRYKVAMNALKQFVFPFAHTYFKDLALPSHLQLNSNKSNVALDNLISRTLIEIEKINSKLDEYKFTVAKQDKCIGIGEFTSGYVSSKPFFVWKNKQHNDKISKLLSGEEVIINSDVRHSVFDKDAIKFNVMNFNFKSENETLQSEIDDILKGFQLTAIHLGDSYYLYEDKIYEMETVRQEIWYYFEKKSNGEPLDYSLSYLKIKNGNVTLSPYASWKIKLDNVTDDITFKDLEVYKDEVDLLLEGHGYYINKRIKNCTNLMVENYYKAIEEYSPKYLIALQNSVEHLVYDNAFEIYSNNQTSNNEELTFYDPEIDFIQNNQEN